MIEHTRDIVVNSRHWLASPRTFNDPFDYAPVPKMPATRLALDSGLQKMRAKVRQQQGRAIADAGYNKFAKRMTLAQARRVILDAVDMWGSTAGVVCYSEVPDSVLMWGHYADSHQGICLEFRPTPHPPAIPLKVRYSNDRPTFKPFRIRDDYEAVIAGISTKAACWGYEQEWREFVYGGARQYLQFDPTELTAVILGAKISQSNEAAVRSWLSDRPDVAVKRARLSSSTFLIEL